MPSGVVHGAGAPADRGSAGAAKATLAKSGMRLMAWSWCGVATYLWPIARISPFVPPVANTATGARLPPARSALNPRHARTPVTPDGQELSRAVGPARPLHCRRGAARAMGGAAARARPYLRIHPLRRKAGLGLPVRRADGR